jgi:phosphoribosylanthranilate isomerase
MTDTASAMNRTGATSLWIKVCGMRTAETIEAAVAAGVQAVGFVFYEPSPRHVSIAEAMALQASVPANVERVAVFLGPSQDLVDAVIGQLQPDCVQMDAHDLAQLTIPPSQRVLPVFRSGAALAQTGDLPQRFLLESARSGMGEKADWPLAARLSRQAHLVLAGGLDAANVTAAISTVRPYGIDVSSGVESSRGVKNAALITEFVRVARAAEARRAI